MDLSKIVDLGFWFDMAPGGWDSFGNVMLILVLLTLVLGFLAKVIAIFQKDKPLVERLLQDFGTISLFFGFTGAFFWITRQQRMPIFSARFWWIILIVVTGVWKVKVMLKVKKYKENKKKYADRKEVYDKYLP